jgi:hypothetical protein
MGIRPAGPGTGGPTIMDDIQLLSEIGQALYGAHWEAALSRKISVSDRSMRRWANGTDRIPWGVWFDVYREVEARALNLEQLKKVLYERVVIKECEPRPNEVFDPKRDWQIEVHDPESGQHSVRHSAIVRSLADVRAVMKNHPGMIFRVTVPFDALAEERYEFSQMNIERV